ncbi:RNA ligase [Vibrio phage EniLVp02]
MSGFLDYINQLPDVVQDGGGDYVAVRPSSPFIPTIRQLMTRAGLDYQEPDEELHCTLAYSTRRFPHTVQPEKTYAAVATHIEHWTTRGGNKTAVVLLLKSKDLDERHEEFIQAGALYDFPDYRPHITLAYYRDDTPPPAISFEPFALVLNGEYHEDLDVDRTK